MGESLFALVTIGTGAIGPEVYALAAAALVLAIGGLAIAAALLGRRGWMTRSAVDFATWTGVLAAGLSTGAAAIHFAVIGEHFAEYPPYGVAFAVFAWFQIAWAVLYIVRRSRGLAQLAIVVNVGALIVWAVSRVAGLPIGPEPGAIEPVGPLDLLAGGLELALIVIIGWDLAASSDRMRPSLSPSATVAYVGSAILAVVVLTSTAFAATGGSTHSVAAHSEPIASGGASGDGHAHPSAAGDSPSASASAAAKAPPASSPGLQPPGSIVFGSALDLAGEIQGPGAIFRPGQTTIWLAHLSEPPDQPTVRFIIVQVLADGREFEHWRQDMTLADPGGRQLVGMADLSIYVHGGAGSYRMRYFRGDELLAEGAFEFAP